MVDPIFTVPAFSALEAAINLALSMAPEAKQELAVHQGKILRLSCLSPNISMDIQLGDTCRVLHSSDQPAEASLEGDLQAWLSLVKASDKASELINGNLKLNGNSKWLIQLGDSVNQLDIDWEGQLANLLGDVPAYIIGQGSKKVLEAIKPLSELLQQGLQNNLDNVIELATEKLTNEGNLENAQQTIEQVKQGFNKIQNSVVDVLINPSPSSSDKSGNSK